MSKPAEHIGGRPPTMLHPELQADDVLATVCGNQANVMMLQHRYEQALALAERSVSLHEAHGSGHGLAVALATLGALPGLVVGAALPFLIAWGFGAVLPLPLEPALHPGDLALAYLYGLLTAVAAGGAGSCASVRSFSPSVSKSICTGS